MTCLHANRTLLRCISVDEVHLVKTWRCDDCPEVWTEHIVKPEPPMQQCDGNCIDCVMWKEPEPEVEA